MKNKIKFKLLVDILKRKLDTAEEKFSKLEHMYKDAILKAA